MTQREILDIALKQSAIDCNCEPGDFLSAKNVITFSRRDARARKYVPLPLECDLISYGNNIVAQVSARTADVVCEFIGRYPAMRCFETPNLHVLDDALRPLGLRVCFMAEYFLPDVARLRPLSCPYTLKILTPPDFVPLYTGPWSDALSPNCPELDVLGVGAYDGDTLVGLAACSADCDSMDQIGVDVLPAYRRQGVAAAVTSRLALEILSLGKVPFYCAAWSNIRSVRNAIKCGFRPAWVELTARETEFVDHMNA